MSEFKARIRTILHAIWYAYFPRAGIRGPFKSIFELWDRLMFGGGHIVGIGGADAHGHSYSLGLLHRVVFPYEYLFRAVNTHILVAGPLTGDMITDRQMIFDALRAGRVWIGCDVLGDTRGLRFEARSGVERVTIGGQVRRAGAVTLEVAIPLPGVIQLVCNGRVVARASGRTLKYLATEAGAYRLEVYRGGKGWIFSNPIFVL